MVELANTCKALPDFDTLQIVHFVLSEPLPVCESARASLGATEKREQALREQVNCVKDLAIGSLKKAKAGCREGGGRKKATVRVIELSPHLPPTKYNLGSVGVEVFEV